MIKVVCYTYLAATTIFLNVIERKYKRQIFPPDPIILEHSTIAGTALLFQCFCLYQRKRNTNSRFPEWRGRKARLSAEREVISVSSHGKSCPQFLRRNREYLSSYIKCRLPSRHFKKKMQNDRRFVQIV